MEPQKFLFPDSSNTAGQYSILWPIYQLSAAFHPSHGAPIPVNCVHRCISIGDFIVLLLVLLVIWLNNAHLWLAYRENNGWIWFFLSITNTTTEVMAWDYCEY